MGNPIVIPEIFKQGMEDFIIPAMVAAPNTTIQNRAEVSGSLKAIAGVERIMFKGISLLDNEFGPNGERVHELDTKDSRVRIVGDMIEYSNVSGSFVSINLNEYFEVTFYGTGLNVAIFQSTGGTYTFSVHADNVLVNTITQGSTNSNILQSRNYGPNVFVNACSGLSLGWHTVRITYATQSIVALFGIYGVEVLNERTDLAVLSGKAVVDGSYTSLSALTTSAFDHKVNGSKGARVVKYIKDNKVKSAVQEVDSASKYLTNADHTNEEVVRRVSWREFGANRSDDWSTLAGVSGDRVFTLDDGTTTLVANDIIADVGEGAFRQNGSVGVGHFTLTFVGTGLDIVVGRPDGSAATSGNSITVDGIVIATDSLIFNHTANQIKNVKVCSGLPYGTHTVRITRGNPSATVNGFINLIIYQPKKPSIPEGAFEVADYNLMADYNGSTITGTAVSDNLMIPTGVLTKLAVRESTYVGAGWGFSSLFAETIGGFNVSNSSNAQPTSITFYGTGFVYHGSASTATVDFTVTIDGVLNASGVAKSNTTNLGGGSYRITSSTVNQPIRVEFTGLTLGLHTVVLQRIGGTASFNTNSIHVITPIHINEPSLKIGNQSLISNQNYDVVKTMKDLAPDLSEAKAWFVWDSTNTRIVSSHNIAAILTTGAGSGHVYFEKPFKRDDYIAIGSANNVDSNVVTFTTKRANSILVQTTTNAGALTHNFVACVFFGELIDE